MGTLRLFPLIRRRIRDVRRTLNIPRGVTLLSANGIGDKDVADRKFLQETNFQEDEFDEDIIPERRAQDQMWRAAGETSRGNAQRPKSLNQERDQAFLKTFIEE